MTFSYQVSWPVLSSLMAGVVVFCDEYITAMSQLRINYIFLSSLRTGVVVFCHEYITAMSQLRINYIFLSSLRTGVVVFCHEYITAMSQLRINYIFLSSLKMHMTLTQVNDSVFEFLFFCRSLFLLQDTIKHALHLCDKVRHHLSSQCFSLTSLLLQIYSSNVRFQPLGYQ